MASIDMDTLQRFMFEHASIRGEIAHLENTYLTIINQRPYPPMVKQLLGEALISCLLLAGSIKFEGQLSLQFQGDVRLPLLLVQCDHDLNLRAMTKFKQNISADEYTQSFLQGQMVLNINQYNKTQTYQSIVPVTSTSMSDNLTNYFLNSEQITTKVWLAAGENRAAGMLLQLMPGQNTQQREEFWAYATHIGETITEQELLTLENEVLLYRLYHETELRLFEARAVQFQCSCSKDNMQQMLRVLGKEEAEKMATEQGEIEVRCDFCNSEFRFDAIDVTMLFRQ